MSTRWAARTSWCSTAPRSCSTPMARWRCSCRPGRKRSASPNGGARTDGGAACRAPSPKSSEGDAANYLACVTGLRDYVDEERLSRRGARAVGRHQLGALRGDGGRCARRRPRAWRHAALHLYQQREPDRCGGDRRGARHPLRHHADPRRGGGLDQRPGEGLRRHRRRTPPRRICSRARAARC